MDSESDYKEMRDEETETDFKPERPTDLKWIGFALIATFCFALSGYILGFLSEAGVAPKYLNSLGYFTISILIILSKQINYIRFRLSKSAEERKQMSIIATLSQSAFYD